VSFAEIILKDDKYHVLDNFASVLEDLGRHYKVPPDLKSTTQQSRVETLTTESWVDVSLALKEDLSVKYVSVPVSQTAA